MTPGSAQDECPECKTRGYLNLPKLGPCQTCLKLRAEYIDRAFWRSVEIVDEGATTQSDAPVATHDVEVPTLKGQIKRGHQAP